MMLSFLKYSNFSSCSSFTLYSSSTSVAFLHSPSLPPAERSSSFVSAVCSSPPELLSSFFPSFFFFLLLFACWLSPFFLFVFFAVGFFLLFHLLFSSSFVPACKFCWAFIYSWSSIMNKQNERGCFWVMLISTIKLIFWLARADGGDLGLKPRRDGIISDSPRISVFFCVLFFSFF